jgi:hypothetical protein
MSWDVMLLSAPPEMKSLGDSPDGFESCLGRRAEVVRKLSALPIDFSNPGWPTLRGDGYSIELNMDGDPIDCIMLHVRGRGAALGAVRAMTEALGVRAFDCQTAKLIDFASPEAEESWRSWRTCRDRVIGRARPNLKLVN